MKLLIGTDAHLFRTPDGRYWCDSVETYSFWTRYLDVFDEIRIVARTKSINVANKAYGIVNGDKVEVWEIPFFQGPIQMLLKYAEIKFALKGCYSGCDCALYRMPSQTAHMVLAAKPKGMPYAGEIVYCPMDDIIGHKFSIIRGINQIISKRLKRFCQNANGVSYVTEKSIQRYYPCKATKKGNSRKYFTSFYSSIVLNNDFFAEPKSKIQDKFLVSMSDAAMNSGRKGEKILINVVKILRNKGYEIEAYIIGDGSKRKEFEEYAEGLGIREYVHFCGKLSGSDEVRKLLLKSDFYVLPTQGEGLPRGILEAMAVGLPVLSSNVGGISEILDKEYLFDYDDSEGYADKLMELISNKEKRMEAGLKNYRKALEYKNDILQKRRNKFYLRLANLCQK